eukprot:6157968-Prorocentrum_lima.AAC.1
MTSSLVGSEMCIRDRLWRSFRPGRQKQEQARLRTHQIGRERRVHPCFSVSYTHLTLPTICSV